MRKYYYMTINSFEIILCTEVHKTFIYVNSVQRFNNKTLLFKFLILNIFFKFVFEIILPF